MKLVKILAVGAVALALAGVASATTVKITGSTAIRKALYAGIVRSLSAGGHVVVVESCDPNFNNKLPDGAQQATFISDTGDTVQTCLAGSVGGIGFVVTAGNVSASITSVGDVNKAWLTAPTYANAVAAGWPTVSVDALGAFTYGAAGAGHAVNGSAGNIGSSATLVAYPTAGTPFDAPATASITMSDSYQNSSPYDSVSWGVTLNDTQEGTVTFALCKGAVHPAANMATAYSHLTNISAQNFQALVNKGYLDLSQITGNTTPLASGGDAGVDVVLVGRNSDSGTRLGVFAETGVGSVSSSAKQYLPLDQNGADASQSTSTKLINSFQLLASTTDGYDSGAFVKQTLADGIFATTSVGPGGHPFIEVAYVSAGDVGGTQLTYNGVAMSGANVINGTYTLWTTEHFMYDPAAVTGAALTLATSIKNNITATNSNGAYVNQGGLLCGRTGVEGSTVLHN